MTILRFALLPAILALCGSISRGQLIVHEWGTFTSLQDEQGNSIGGINTDDEPVPPFVHRIAGNVLLSTSQASPALSKGLPSCHPDVTMRLETPVLYFHPPADWKSQPIDVHVKFNGGWLTEYWPDAIFRAPGLLEDAPGQVISNDTKTSGSNSWVKFGHLTGHTVGELSWQGLVLGGDDRGPDTSDQVWLAPRAVDAAPVKTPGGECEKYLFYRGVGHVDAPIRVVRVKERGRLEIWSNFNNTADYFFPIPAAWLVKVNADGACAFQSLGPLASESFVRGTARDGFAPGDFQPGNLARLRGELGRALVSAGLYRDEADALLNTWSVSYFKSPGMRLFYICPRAETESLLPLEISVPATVSRVMVGRIELVTPEQRAVVKKIAAEASLEDSDPRAFYPQYLTLGRFRNALILDEEKRNPSAGLEKFIEKNGLQPYEVN